MLRWTLECFWKVSGRKDFMRLSFGRFSFFFPCASVMSCSVDEEDTASWEHAGQGMGELEVEMKKCRGQWEGPCRTRLVKPSTPGRLDFGIW
jgi:hypothetical protein